MSDDVTTQAPPTGDATPPPTGDATTPPTGDATPPAAGSLATGAPAPEPTTPKGDWPENWRNQIAGEDGKELKRLERYGSPGDLWNAYRNAETALSKAQQQQGLPADASEEQVASYREANGIPKAPDGYLDALPEGLVLSDADKQVASNYLERMHAQNVSPATVHEGLTWYQDTMAQQQQQQQQNDLAYRGETAQALSQEYGAEYQQRMNAVKSLLDTAPPLEDGTPLATVLENARLPNGQLIGDNPSMVKFFADLAYQINPAGFVTPTDGAGQLDTVNTELNNLKEMMGNPGSEYWKGPKAAGHQERYRTLLDAQEKLQQRN